MPNDTGYGEAVNAAQGALDQGAAMEDQAQAAPAAENPVMQSLETIMMFAKSLEEKGDPKGAAITQALNSLMQAMGAGGAPAGPEAMPPAPAEAAGPMSPGEEMAQKKQPQIM